MCLNLAQDVADTSGPGDAGRGESLFSVEEVKAFFDRRAIRLNRESLKMLWALACLPGWGSFRVLERLASIARRTSPGRVLSRADVRGLLKIMMPRDVRAIDRLTEIYIERTAPARKAMAATA